MTDFIEEQRNEIEALESIYPSEFEIIEVEPQCQFTVFIKTDRYEEGGAHGAACKLCFSYVPNYPDEPPNLDIKDAINIEEDECERLKDVLKEEAENNVGMVMIFTLVSVAQEWLNTKLEEINKKKQEEYEKQQREKEIAELKRFEGTPVTVETFIIWKAQFDAEMAELKKTVQKDETSKKLTGRELFERDHTLNESDIQFMLEGEEEVKVDESLFQDFGDLM